jgi:hypothetical protein
MGDRADTMSTDLLSLLTPEQAVAHDALVEVFGDRVTVEPHHSGVRAWLLLDDTPIRPDTARHLLAWMRYGAPVEWDTGSSNIATRIQKPQGVIVCEPVLMPHCDQRVSSREWGGKVFCIRCGARVDG